tara:strand:- start:16729 stop:16980 length:252 start_codon:yes stop_codon:yes gene_type:complete
MERKKFKEGDLVYIPQAVLLWADSSQNKSPYMKTDKPMTALCMSGLAEINPKTNDRLIQIYAKGQAWAVHEKDVFPLEKNNVG